MQVEAKFLSTYSNGETIKTLCHYNDETHEVSDIATVDRPHLENWGAAIEEKVELSDGTVYPVVEKDGKHIAQV